MADRNLQMMQNSASERVPLLCETEDFKRGPPASKIPSKPSGAGYDANERCEALGNLRSLKRLIVAWEPEVILRHYTRCTEKSVAARQRGERSYPVCNSESPPSPEPGRRHSRAAMVFRMGSSDGIASGP